MDRLRQAEATRYRRAARRRGVLAQLVATLLLGLVALSAGRIDASLPGPAPMRAVLLVFATGLLLELAGLPFAVRGYLAARDVGLQRQTPAGWLADRGKGLGLALALGGPAVALLVVAQRTWPTGWPLAAWLAATIVGIVLTLAAPVLLLPLFLRTRRLEEGPLRAMAEDLVRRSGLAVRDIRLLELSAKTSGANAAVVGLGPTRRILLGDTLVDGEDGGLDETRAVLAHELGHHAGNDLWRLTAVQGALALVTFTATARLFTALPDALVHGGAGHPAALPALALAYGTVALPVGFLAAWHSRRLERAADRYAVDLAGPTALVRAFERLVVTNLAELDPPVLSRLRSSHPAPAERIAAARARPQDSPRLARMEVR